jgi:hypothetical protein
VRIGANEKGQVWKYVTELMDTGHVTDSTTVYGWVLGDSIRATEARERREGDRVIIRPLLYNNFIGQAEKRMMNLQQKLMDAPFMKQALEELYPTTASKGHQPPLPNLDVPVPAAVAS